MHHRNPQCDEKALTYDAAIINYDVPTDTTANRTYVSITVRNIGTTLWTAERKFGLGLVRDGFVFQSSPIDLNWGVSVAPAETNTFTFVVSVATTLRTHTMSGVRCQIFQDAAEYFGQALSFIV